MSKYVISTPHGYVYSYVVDMGYTEIEEVLYTRDLNEAYVFDSDAKVLTRSLWEDYLGIRYDRGFSFRKVEWNLVFVD